MSVTADPGWVKALVGGLGALGTPALTLSAVALAAAGLAASRRRVPIDHVLTALLVAGLYSVALARRGPESPDTLTRWVLVGVGLVLLDTGRRRVRSIHPSVLLWSLLLTTAAVLLRSNLRGPMLGVLEGPWQHEASFADVWPYHLGGGVVLAALYGLGALVGWALPQRPVGWVGLAVGVTLMLLTGLDLLASIQQQLLLHWPPVTWG